MPVNLKVKTNPTRQYPVRGDGTNYGSDATLWAQDVTASINSIGAQYTYIMGSAAQVTSGEATHSDWTVLLAAATDGDSVWVKNGTYTFASIFNITKRLTIQNESSDCIYIAAAGIAAGAILKFSAAASSFDGGTISQGAGTPQYAFEVNAIDVWVNVLLSGVYSVQNILFTFGTLTFSGVVRDAVSASIYGVAGTGANIALSNLANPTTISQSLTPNADNAIDLGTAAKKWKDIQVNNVKGADLVGGTIGNITPVTIIKCDNYVINGDIIENTTGDLLINATGVAKKVTIQSNANVVLSPVAGSEATRIVGGGVEANLVWDYLIQNYTVVGNVGDAGQFMAGNTPTLAELQHFFTVVSYYKFGAGAALPTDEVGTYSYTLGAAAKAPSNGTGLWGAANTSISFDGGDYATHATKFDDMTTTFSGAGKGLVHSFWVQATADGQPAGTNAIFYKSNAANNSYEVILSTTGQIIIYVYGNSATLRTCSSTTVLPNGANTIWTHVVACWDTTYGLRLFINGVCESTEASATTLMTDGTLADFFFGGENTTPTNPFTGFVANEVILNKVATQRDIDILFATTIPEPATLLSKEYKIIEKVQPEADTNFEIQSQCQVVAKYNAKIYLQGRQYGETDKVKLIGEVD